MAVADALRLPYRSASCDAAISIAVLHHLSSDARRRQAIRELLRIVKSGDRILITVWAREQEDPKLLGKWTPLIGTEAWPEDLVAGGRQPGGGGIPLEQAPGKGSLAGERTGIEWQGSVQGQTGAAERSGTEVGTMGEGAENGHGPSSDAHERSLRERRPSGTLESIPESGARAPRTDGATDGVGASGREGDVRLDPAEKLDSPSPESVPRAEPDTKPPSTSGEAPGGLPCPGVGSGGSLHPGNESGGVQEYFVPWHLPYHRVEIGAADRDGQRGLARRDPLKQALVYERYYHVFVEGELER